MEGLIVQLIVSAVFGTICSLIAISRGRSGVGWFFIGAFTGCIGLILVLVLPDLKAEEARRRHLISENRRLRERLKKDRQVADQRYIETRGRLEVHDAALGVDTGNRLAAPPGAEVLPPATTPDAVDPSTDFRAMKWFYAMGDKKIGPIDFAAIQRLWKSQRIKPSTQVWAQALETWQAIEMVPGLEDELDG